MNTILLHPTDLLFFRDGRPMGGASSGHGAAWPMPNIINHAFHAALHRAGDVFESSHSHRRGRSGDYSDHKDHRDRKFGSLVTAGPFPVCTHGADHTWFFPRPADADDSGKAVLFPAETTGPSSLDAPCIHPVVSSVPPNKETPKTWWNEGAWNAYLGSKPRNDLSKRIFMKRDSDFSDTEHQYGIGISPESGTVEEGRLYSAHYLRLRESWKLGTFATAPDKDLNQDLVRKLLNGQGCQIIAGGQQRVCTATLDEKTYERLPLPNGKTTAFEKHGDKWLVKWILLTPAIFPGIEEGISKRGTLRKKHSGGWLPTWICPESGRVLLQTIDDAERKRRRILNAAGKGYKSIPDISATLVAAITGKPQPVTGWALPNGTDREQGGAKSTHLAVPAGSVYYFECADEMAATKLANALNWHGTTPGTEIQNRRSTLMGEKGFGLGVCGTWNYF